MIHQFLNTFIDKIGIRQQMTTTPSLSRSSLHTLPKTSLHDYKLVSTHLLDGIYEGFVNSSYQRDGFGILQSENYDTYLGFFKYNKPHGLGVIIFRDGPVVYGNFCHGQLSGISLTDNGHQLQLGVFGPKGMTGIGYQQKAQTHSWKMNKYHKGVAIQVLDEQIFETNDTIPEMLNYEPEVLRHYINYQRKQFFKLELGSGILKNMIENVNDFYLHQIGKEQFFFGARFSGRFQGIGVLYDNAAKRVIETGYYRQGILDGYGLKIDYPNNRSEQGRWAKGKKDGIFLQKTKSETLIMFYLREKGSFGQKRGGSIADLKKQQKIYNYRQKDFLSLRHQINFDHFRDAFDTGSYKAWKMQQQQERKKQEDNSRSARGKSTSVNKYKHKGTDKKSNLHSEIHASETPCVQIMRDKIMNLTNKNKSSNAHGKNQKKTDFKILESEVKEVRKERLKMLQEYQDDIAVEDSPIWKEPNISSKRHVTNFNKNSKQGRNRRF